MESASKQQIFVGIDIGGTLSKLCIWCPTGVNLKFPNLENLTGAVLPSFLYLI